MFFHFFMRRSLEEVLEGGKSPSKLNFSGVPYITFQAPKRRVDVEWKKFRSEAQYKNNCCNRVCRINATGKSFPLEMCGHLGRYYFRWKVTCRIYQLELFPSGKAETCIRKVLFSLYKLIPNQSNKRK